MGIGKWPEMGRNRMKSVDRISRRSFTRITSSAVASLATGGLTAAHAANKASENWKMKLCTSSVMFDRLPIEEVCEIVSGLGLKGLDIWGPFTWGGAQCRHLADIKKRLGGKGLRELMTKYKLEVATFTSYATPYSDYWELIRDYGGGIVVRGTGEGRLRSPQELVPRMKAFFEKLKPDIELARKGGAKLAIENHANDLLDTHDSFKAFVELNPDPEHLGIAVAPYHLQSQKTPVEEFIRTAGSQCLFFYAWQNGKDVKQMPGFGPADFNPWLAALAEIDFAHYSSIFMHSHPPPKEMEAALAESKKYLLKCRVEI